MASLCASPSLATDVTLRGRAKLDSRRRLQALKQIINCPRAARWSPCLSVRSMDRAHRCHVLRTLPQLLLPFLCHSMECLLMAMSPRAMCPPCMPRLAPKPNLLKGGLLMNVKYHLLKCLALEALKLLLLSCMHGTCMMPPAYLSSLSCCREPR